MSIYQFSATAMSGHVINFEEFKNKVVLIVNTASHCGFTSQYENLQLLYDRYKDKGFTILGFPCNQFANQEPEDNENVHSFCKLNYGVSFPMFRKVNVRDHAAHPLFEYLVSTQPFNGFDDSHPVTKGLINFLEKRHPEYLTGDSIKWNFTKFLVNQRGEVIKRFEPTTDPIDIDKDIKELLKL
ncbi:glutathione peroxidase [Bacillus sp. CGMCC 1.16607]|uniref:glutathione peroxidase n=1 Tax=Bacillus sp. CGMCC 1.16607 TaxID=3351842 RepID=UPI0036285CF2